MQDDFQLTSEQVDAGIEAWLAWEERDDYHRANLIRDVVTAVRRSGPWRPLEAETIVKIENCESVPPNTTPDWASKRAKEILDQWWWGAEQEAMRSMDPEYLNYLKGRTELGRAAKEFMVEHVAAGLRKEREFGAQEIKAMLRGRVVDYLETRYGFSGDVIEGVKRKFL